MSKLYDEVKKYGGEIVIFSSLHPSGERLKNITGIAAVLRFDVLSEDNEDDYEDQEEKALVESDN